MILLKNLTNKKYTFSYLMIFEFRVHILWLVISAIQPIAVRSIG